MTEVSSSLGFGKKQLSHRIVLAPLTRMRSAQPGDIPTELNAEYYGQRASQGGFLITEATQISKQGKGYPATPGIHSDEQVEGWKKVTEAVHAKGGIIFLQLWHVGRISHSSLHPEDGLPVAPSPIAPAGKTMTADFKQAPYETPRALEIEDLEKILADYRRASENAKKAGFDGVEIHMANGYLLDQFLQNGSNQRSDEYGGSIENRLKFPLRVLDEVTKVWSVDEVGVRISPYGTFNSMSDSDPIPLFESLIKEFNARKILYVHAIEPRASMAGGAETVIADVPSTSELFRKHFQGIWISAGGYTPELAKEGIAKGNTDLVAFGRYFISNPDLPKRVIHGIELNPYNRKTFYGGGKEGYTDYPFAS
ncbi:N-ethylmaleimide reductase, FMN-linked [Leptospira ryugenii]|uniref:N-ethylmaleimide reductase, FMN-linked n=1 Tax=Leptospira ryugenii TaxID=1917863 RepID=A0A2P2E1U0_9LEPT|nr:alkene reductase [Leptospira ryugenii]GBF50766.1 N-ethylmaleimide reductase, FMN-linked [Leptospira ryugenii]